MKRVRQWIEEVHEIMHRIEGRLDAMDDLRPQLHFADDEPKVIPFPGNPNSTAFSQKAKQPPAERQEADFLPNVSNDVAGTPMDIEQGYVEFTDKEILTMPKQLQRIILVNRKRCRIRRKPCGKHSYTYEIRFRADGYNVSACGKTKELAKTNMLQKLKTAKPIKKTDPHTVPTLFNEFAFYYFENFRKEKVTPGTMKKDILRFHKYLEPHFKGVECSKITPSDCKRLLDRVKNEGHTKTATEIYSLMSVIFKNAIAHHLMDRNPLEVVLYVQHVTKSGTALSDEEQDTLFQAVKGTKCELAIALALYCGLRPNELKTVRVEGPFIVAVNSKRKKREVAYKRIPIIDRLRPFLPADGIFDIPKLTYLAERVKKALPNHKLYDLRTTFYSKCKELGVAEHAFKEFVGHSLGALGNAYTSLSDEYLLSEGSKLNKW